MSLHMVAKAVQFRDCMKSIGVRMGDEMEGLCST